MDDGPFQQGMSIVAAVAFSSTREPQQQTIQLSAAGGELTIDDYRGELLDPSTVTLVLRKGDGASSRSIYGAPAQTYTITKDAVGLYYTQILLDVPGRWIYRWEGDAGTSTAKVSWEAEIQVKPVRVSVP